MVAHDERQLKEMVSFSLRKSCGLNRPKIITKELSGEETGKGGGAGYWDPKNVIKNESDDTK